MAQVSTKGDAGGNDSLVSCDICLTEIPVSAAKNEETSDYVFHFCGIDCYAKWKELEKHQHNQKQKSK